MLIAAALLLNDAMRYSRSGKTEGAASGSSPFCWSSWHWSNPHSYHYSLNELAALVELTPVEVASDGGVYEVSRREPDD